MRRAATSACSATMFAPIKMHSRWMGAPAGRRATGSMRCCLSSMRCCAAECTAGLESVGLDPQVGFLHALRPGRPALALDLMEEFRPIIADRLALTLINRKQLQSRSFCRPARRCRSSQRRWAKGCAPGVSAAERRRGKPSHARPKATAWAGAVYSSPAAGTPSARRSRRVPAISFAIG